MSNPLFTEVSVEQQETVAGGISFNFSTSQFDFTNLQSTTNTTTDPVNGTVTTGQNINVVIRTGGVTFNGFNLPADFTLG